MDFYPQKIIMWFKYVGLLDFRLESTTIAGVGNMWPPKQRSAIHVTLLFRVLLLNSRTIEILFLRIHLRWVWKLVSNNTYSSMCHKYFTLTYDCILFVSVNNYLLSIHYIIFLSHCNMKSPPGPLENQGTSPHLFSQDPGLTCKM